MRTKRFILSILSLIMAVSMVGASVIYASAGNGGVLQALVQDETLVKAYIRGSYSADGAEYQIADIETDPPSCYPISEDPTPMRTLIMVDNSISIPKDARDWIKESIKAIVDAHGENELFRLSTFSEGVDYKSDQYLNDYTLVKNLADSIVHEDQETYLTDVLYDLVEELNSEEYTGYTRIIIFSDGVDNKPLGVTKEELYSMLKETPYPIYTFGAVTKNNNDELENMYALSRITGCESRNLEENAASEIAQITSQDNSLTVFTADIPLKAKIGGRQSSQLTLSDGTKFEFLVKMPFDKRAVEPEPEEPEPTIIYVEPDEPDEPEEPEEEEFPWPLVIGLGAGALLLITVTVLAIVLILKNQKKKNTQPVPQAPVRTETYEKTEMLGGNNRRESGTVHMTPDAGFGEVKRYRFALTDVADSSRTFKCELVNEIKIGRQPDNNIVLSDDTAVHGHQSVVSVENGVFYYSDVKDVKNHSAVNDKVIQPGMKHLVVTNSRVKIGRHAYVISIT